MTLDIKRYKNQINKIKPEFNLVPFIDVLFILLIFLVVSSNFNSSDIDDTKEEGGTGKPNITDTTGDLEYYLLPVTGLEKVTVNGQDMSSLIKDHTIAVHTKVMDEGEINIKPKEKAITITTPPDVTPKQAIISPD
jgi:biopolymer transport protein ExbD